MKLKSFGCSFIFGTDLHDDGSGEDFARFSHHTYPALLSKKLGYTYECYARAGAGNLQILQRLLDEISKNESCLYVINWTWVDRFSYIAEETRHDRNPLGWQTIMPVGDDTKTDFYYRNLHSEIRDKLTSLVFIKNAIDALKQQHAPFIMTNVDDIIFDDRWNVTNGMVDIQNYIRPYFSSFAGESFLVWSRKQGYKISDAAHPLEEAHRAASELISSDIDSWIKS